MHEGQPCVRGAFGVVPTQVVEALARNFSQDVPVHVGGEARAGFPVPFPKKAHRSAERGLAAGALHDAGVAEEREDGAFDVNAPFAAGNAHAVTVQPRVVTRLRHAQVEAAGVVEVAFQEFGHQVAPALQLDDARLKEEEVPHVGRHALRDVAQTRRTCPCEIVWRPLCGTDALHVPSMVELVACDADDFHVAFFGTDALRGPEGDDGAVLVLYAVPHVPVREEVQEVVFVGREGAEVRDLGPRERRVVRHELRGIARQGVVNPDVNVQVLLAIAVVPKLGGRDPRAVHHVLDVAGAHHGRTVEHLPRQGRRQRPAAFHVRIESEVLKHDLVGQVLPIEVVHEAIHRVDVIEVSFYAGRSCIEDVGVKHPLNVPHASRDNPGVQAGLGQGQAGAVGVKAFNAHDVLGEVAKLITPRAPRRELERPSIGALRKIGAEVERLASNVPPQFALNGAHRGPTLSKSEIGWPVVPLG